MLRKASRCPSPHPTWSSSSRSRRPRRAPAGTPGRRRPPVGARRAPRPRQLGPPVSPGREDALQRDAEVEGQRGLHVVVREAAAGHRGGGHGQLAVLGRLVDAAALAHAQEAFGETALASAGSSRRRAHRVAVRRDLGLQQRDGLGAAGLAEVVQREPRPWPGASGALPCRSGSANVLLAVAAVGRAEQREQRGVLRDRQQLAVAQRPALGREVERKMRISATNGSACRS